MAFFARDAFICTCKKEECDLCNKKYFEPFTNADRIRAMTNAELARFFDNIETKNYFGEYLGKLGWLEWLRQEV